jgi:hypothetical protein
VLTKCQGPLWIKFIDLDQYFGSIRYRFAQNLTLIAAVLPNTAAVLINITAMLINITAVLTNIASVLTNIMAMLINIAPVLINIAPVLININAVLTNTAAVLINITAVLTNIDPVLIDITTVWVESKRLFSPLLPILFIIAFTCALICRDYSLNNIAIINLLSDFTRSGRQFGSNGVEEYPVCDVTPPRPAKYGTFELR